MSEEDELVIGAEGADADGAGQEDIDNKPVVLEDEKIVIKKKRPMPRYLKEKLLLRPALPHVKTSFPKKKYVGTNVSCTSDIQKEKLRKLMADYEAWGKAVVPFLNFDVFLQKTADYGSSRVVKNGMERLRYRDGLTQSDDLEIDFEGVTDDVKLELGIPLEVSHILTNSSKPTTTATCGSEPHALLLPPFGLPPLQSR